MLGTMYLFPGYECSCVHDSCLELQIEFCELSAPWIYLDFVHLVLLLGLSLCPVDLPWICRLVFCGLALTHWICLEFFEGVLFVGEGNFRGILVQSWNHQ